MERGEVGIVPKIYEEAELNLEKGWVFIPIKDVHAQKVPHRSTDFHLLECKVLHTPINSNFWHFSIRWHFDGKDKDKWPKKIRNLMKTTGRSFLIEIIEYSEPNYIELSQELYVM